MIDYNFLSLGLFLIEKCTFTEHIYLEIILKMLFVYW